MLEVRPLDPHDDAEWQRFHDAYLEATLHERPYAEAHGSDTHRVTHTRAGADFGVSGWAAWSGADVVGTATVVRPLLDNTNLAWLDLLVVPGARRQGVGSALLGSVEEAVRREGRTVAQAEIVCPVDVPRDQQPGIAFATARGYVHAQSETHSVLDLPPQGDLLERLEAHAAERLGDYRLLSWAERTPDEWVEQVCRLEEAFVTEAPMGDLSMEPERWSPERVRDVEERRRARRQRAFVTVGVAPDGSLAGNTELLLGAGTVRGGAVQNGTLVLPVHRGHRLGLAMKVANLRRLLAHDDSPRLVHTFNAGVNAPMLAVNAALGFRAVEQVEEWERTLT